MARQPRVGTKGDVVDNTVALPKQVQAQLDAAEQLIQSMTQPGEAPEEGIPPADAPPEPPEPAAPVDTPPAPPVDWQKRFEVLQGKYNAEVPRLYETVRERDARLAAAEQRLQAAQAKPQEAPKAEQLVTAQDDEKFGSDLVELMRRVVREGVSPALQRLETVEKIVLTVPQIQRKVESAAEEVAQSRSERFWSELTTAVPDWKEVNGDAHFLAWLEEFDPVAGAKRQAALDQASNALDHARVAAIFKLFKAQNAPAAKPQRPSQNPELARQVAPAKSAKTAATPQGEKTYSGAQYSYWNDPRRYHDTPKADREAMQAELERALQEGRIKF